MTSEGLLILKTTGDQFRRLQEPIGVCLKSLRPNVPVFLAEETDSPRRGPLVQQLRVMGDQYKLRIVILHRFLRREQPWLNLPQRDEIVRLIDKYRIAPGYHETQNHVQHKQAPLPLGKLRYCEAHLLAVGARKVGPQSLDADFIGSESEGLEPRPRTLQKGRELHVLDGVSAEEVTIPSGEVLKFVVGISLLPCRQSHPSRPDIRRI